MERKNTAYVLMGYPGSGKSYFAKNIINNDIPLNNFLYLSSDDLREELYGFRDQTHNKEVFEELYRRAIEHSSEGDVIIDSTALTRKDRLRVIELLKKYYSLHLICVVRNLDLIVQVNRSRFNTKEFIPEDIFKQILGRFQFPTFDEGWDFIDFYLNDDFSSDYFGYRLFSILASGYGVEHNNPHHSESILDHIFQVYNVSKPCYKELALFHDLGKFYVRSFNEEKNYYQYLGHAAVSMYLYLFDNLFRSRQVSSNSLISFDRVDDMISLYTMFEIYYHDQPYACSDKDSLFHSLSKSSKPLKYLFGDDLEEFVDDLIEFNKYDRYREDEDEQDS